MELKVWPRQPFIGLALAALLGIILADSWPHWLVGAAFALCLGGFALVKQSSRATYGFAAACFFLLHSLQMTEAPGVRLARELGDEPQALVTRGTVVSEPRVSARGV